MIRPLDSTKVAAVMRIHSTVRQSGTYEVLAAKRGDRWELLRDGIALPAPPVRRSTGASWQPSYRLGTGLLRVPKAIAVLVTADKIVLGRTGGEPVSIDGHDFAALDAKLAELKKLPDFAMADAIQVSGTGNATYGVLVKAIDAVKKRGFDRWRLVGQQALIVKLGAE